MIRTIFITAALLLAGPASAQPDPVANRVEINEMQLYYEVFGEGEPLIVLHGAYMTIPDMG